MTLPPGTTREKDSEMSMRAPAPPSGGSESDHYAEYTERNAGVIDAATQAALRRGTVLVAGCGSIGGAAVEPLVRLGVRSFLLAEPGEYELNNLNRQNAVAADVGRNKADVAAERVCAIAPTARVKVFPDGVNESVVEELTTSCDVIVDGVDVTTMSGLQAKFLLHEHAAARRLPLVTGWDMAGAQYVRFYDYRKPKQPFDGQIVAEDLERLTLWQILGRLVPARYVPLEMVQLARKNLTNTDPDFHFPQLVYAADLFGAMVSHVVAELLAGRTVAEHMYFDAHQSARPAGKRLEATVRRSVAALGLLARMKRAS
jgi:tRNA threonylcarbamoyladenosine dehydratase